VQAALTLGDARGSRAETPVAGTKRGRADDAIALNDAYHEGWLD
jgi:hypothetical protein